MTALRMLALASLAGLVLANASIAAPKPAPAASYGLVFLRSGVRPPITPAEADSMQKGHLGNIRRMSELGALAAAGPFGDATSLRGIFLFEPDSIASLDRLLEPDPIVSAGRLVCEPHVWRAEPGVGKAYRERRASEPGRQDSMVTFTMVLLHRGPRWTANVTRELPGLLKRQKKELDRQRAAKQLAMAGPIDGLGELRGVYLYDTDTTTAKALVARDPAVKAGRLVPEIHPWWTAYGVIPGR